MQKNTQNLVLIILFSIICVIIFSQNLSNRTRQQIEYNERYQEYDIEKSKDDDTYNADNQNKLLSWAEINRHSNIGRGNFQRGAVLQKCFRKNFEKSRGADFYFNIF